MASLDVTPSSDVLKAQAQTERWGRWLMAGYWLALLAIMALAGLGSGG